MFLAILQIWWEERPIFCYSKCPMRSHPAQYGEDRFGPPTLERSGSEHRRAVTSFLLRRKAWLEVELSLQERRRGRKKPLSTRKDGMICMQSHFDNHVMKSEWIQRTKGNDQRLVVSLCSFRGNCIRCICHHHKGCNQTKDGEGTTQIYLNSIKSSEVDDANAKIVAAL